MTQTNQQTLFFNGQSRILEDRGAEIIILTFLTTFLLPFPVLADLQYTELFDCCNSGYFLSQA